MSTHLAAAVPPAPVAHELTQRRQTVRTTSPPHSPGSPSSETFRACTAHPPIPAGSQRTNPALGGEARRGSARHCRLRVLTAWAPSQLSCLTTLSLPVQTMWPRRARAARATLPARPQGGSGWPPSPWLGDPDGRTHGFKGTVPTVSMAQAPEVGRWLVEPGEGSLKSPAALLAGSQNTGSAKPAS